MIKNATIYSDHFISGGTRSTRREPMHARREHANSMQKDPWLGFDPRTILLQEGIVPKAVHDDLKQKYSQLNMKCDNLHVDIIKLKAENKQLNAMIRTTQFSFASLNCKPAQLLFFTGLTSALFNWVLQMVKDSVEVVCDSVPGGPSIGHPHETPIRDHQ
ncbi:hypothetical protein ILYODFUR_013623 [Ilyodon furcidens]|uniref:Uncharacterized protein n=1 Tax=Ilyodon furcidens TaxID=33524 RepID=A0ABV0TMD9_9TELE